MTSTSPPDSTDSYIKAVEVSERLAPDDSNRAEIIEEICGILEINHTQAGAFLTAFHTEPDSEEIEAALSLLNEFLADDD